MPATPCHTSSCGSVCGRHISCERPHKCPLHICMLQRRRMDIGRPPTAAVARSCCGPSARSLRSTPAGTSRTSRTAWLPPGAPNRCAEQHMHGGTPFEWGAAVRQPAHTSSLVVPVAARGAAAARSAAAGAALVSLHSRAGCSRQQEGWWARAAATAVVCCTCRYMVSPQSLFRKLWDTAALLTIYGLMFYVPLVIGGWPACGTLGGSLPAAPRGRPCRSGCSTRGPTAAAACTPRAQPSTRSTAARLGWTCSCLRMLTWERPRRPQASWCSAGSPQASSW